MGNARKKDPRYAKKQRASTIKRIATTILTGTGPDGSAYAVKRNGRVVRGEDDLRISWGRGHGYTTCFQVGDHYNHATVVMRIRGDRRFVAPVGRGGGPVRDPSAELAPRRTPRRASQTRARLGRFPWTTDEDATLAREHAAFPSDWARIARSLPGRNETSIQRRWQCTVRIEVAATQQSQQTPRPPSAPSPPRAPTRSEKIKAAETALQIAATKWKLENPNKFGVGVRRVPCLKTNEPAVDAMLKKYVADLASIAPGPVIFTSVEAFALSLRKFGANFGRPEENSVPPNVYLSELIKSTLSNVSLAESGNHFAAKDYYALAYRVAQANEFSKEMRLAMQSRSAGGTAKYDVQWDGKRYSNPGEVGAIVQVRFHENVWFTACMVATHDWPLGLDCLLTGRRVVNPANHPDCDVEVRVATSEFGALHSVNAILACY